MVQQMKTLYYNKHYHFCRIGHFQIFVQQVRCQNQDPALYTIIKDEAWLCGNETNIL